MHDIVYLKTMLIFKAAGFWTSNSVKIRRQHFALQVNAHSWIIHTRDCSSGFAALHIHSNQHHATAQQSRNVSSKDQGNKLKGIANIFRGSKNIPSSGRSGFQCGTMLLDCKMPALKKIILQYNVFSHIWSTASLSSIIYNVFTQKYSKISCNSRNPNLTVQVACTATVFLVLLLCNTCMIFLIPKFFGVYNPKL